MKKLLTLVMLVLCAVVFAQPKPQTDLQRLESWFGHELTNAKGEKVPVKSLEGKMIGIYFSAHWCGPCRAFTPELVKFRDKLAKENKPFEIIFVSGDRKKEEMAEYIKDTKMKWLAVPFDAKEKDALYEMFSVSGIPALIIVDSKGNILTREGRSDVMQHPMNAFTMWRNKSNKIVPMHAPQAPTPAPAPKKSIKIGK